MKLHRRALLAGAAAALTACSRPQQKTASTQDDVAAPSVTPGPVPDPAGVVRPLYAPYLSEGARFPAFRDQAPWSADLWAKLDAMVALSSEINEPILDFDPLIGAQDYQLSALTVRADSVAAGSHAVVRAHFVNLGREEVILYDLVWEGGGWRVDNIRGADWDLRQIASEAPAN